MLFSRGRGRKKRKNGFVRERQEKRFWFAAREKQIVGKEAAGRGKRGKDSVGGAAKASLLCGAESRLRKRWI